MQNNITPKRVIGGVCVSISQKFNLPVIWVRLGAVIITFFFWPALAIYIILWVIKPFKSKQVPIHNDDLENIDDDLVAEKSLQLETRLNTGNSSVQTGYKPTVEKRRAIKPSPIVMLVIILLGISPMIGSVVGGKDWVALHWFTIATFPIAVIVLIIYLIIVYLMSSRG